MKDKLVTVGKKVLVAMGNGIMVECTIVDYKFSYGVDRWKVVPLKGTGSAWVQNYTEIE